MYLTENHVHYCHVNYIYIYKPYFPGFKYRNRQHLNTSLGKIEKSHGTPLSHKLGNGSKVLVLKQMYSPILLPKFKHRIQVHKQQQQQQQNNKDYI